MPNLKLWIKESPLILCANCGRPKTKHTKPFKPCRDCGRLLCARCVPTNPEHPPLCRPGGCRERDFKRRYALEKKAEIKAAPPCKKCGKKHLKDNRCLICCKKIPEGRIGYTDPPYCKPCYRFKKLYDKSSRIENARRGLVEVRYGPPDPEVPILPDGGSGYAYQTDIPDLRPGDVVRVPGNWREPNASQAVVVSTYSDYSGSTSNIIGLIRRANPNPATASQPEPPKETE